MTKFAGISLAPGAHKAGICLALLGYSVLGSPLWAASDRVSLKGYQDFVFGTKEAELRQTVAVRKESPDSKQPGDLWLESQDRVILNDEEYELHFLLRDKLLVQVNLSRGSEMSIIECEDALAKLVGMVQDEYGPSDGPPDAFTNLYITYLNSWRFTFQDGALIIVSAAMTTGSNKCIRNIAFKAGTF